MSKEDADMEFNGHMNHAFGIITSSAFPITAESALASASAIARETSNPRAARAEISAYRQMMQRKQQQKDAEAETRIMYEREWLMEDARRGR